VITERRRFLVEAGLVLLLSILVGSALLGARVLTPSTVPLEPHIPNEQMLIAEGLSGTPGPNQPTWPIAVDRVLGDGAATYVQFHVTGSAGQGRYPLPLLLPTLSDDRGTLINEGSMGSIDPPAGSLPLPSWLPWCAPLVQRGYAILGPLPAAAHAAILRFAVGETVAVRLNLGPIAARHVTYPGQRVRAGGLTLTVREVDGWHVTYTYAFRAVAGEGGTAVRPLLSTADGRTLTATNVVSSCQRRRVSTGLMTCRDSWVFPPQRRGTRLTLTVPAFELNTKPGRFITVYGPWHLPFVAP
jgi:hypothetical protein